jgi:hypothetical protein
MLWLSYLKQRKGTTNVTENQANIIANALGGDPWQSGGGIYVVLMHRQDGKLIALTTDCVCEYENEKAFDTGQPLKTVRLV